MAQNDPSDPRSQNNRLHLNFGYNERSLNPPVPGRNFPTTPSAFPQPVYPAQQSNGQPEVWGATQQTPNAYTGGPPSYFMQRVQYADPQYQPQTPSTGGYLTPGGGYNDGTNGLVHQFSHQNLGAVSPRPASPYVRNQSPAVGPGVHPRNPNQPRQQGQQGQQVQYADGQQAYGQHSYAGGQQQYGGGQYFGSQYGNHLAAPNSTSQNGSSAQEEDELPPKQPDRYSDNVYRRAKASTELIGSFFKTNVERARDRNARAKELDQVLSDSGIDQRKKDQRVNFNATREAQYLRFLRLKERPENFGTLKIIGKGAFGEVKLVKRKTDDKIYALKSLVKSEMYKRDQLAHVRSERDILAESDSAWVVKLFTTFQDSTFLYMLMEYLPGGDLMTMLIKYEVFSEDITRFYMAELTLAIEAVHKLGFIHRDIKPDNILLDKGGHIKLTDFGLSTGFHKEHDGSYYQQLMHGKAPKASARDNRNSVNLDQIQLTVSNRDQINTWRKSRRQLAYSTVGTPDYIAPEIFTGKGYDFACDWWSMGTIAFECLIGWPPFCAEETTDTYRKIVDWPRHLVFPPDQKLSDVAENFVRSLITHRSQRLGSGGGAAEIKRHAFFRGVDWNTLRRIRAPFEPKLSSAIDTQYFPVDEIPQQDTAAQIRARDEANNAAGGDAAAETSLPFIGYTYRRFDAFSR